MSGITTHILDTSLGKPAVGVSVTLSRKADGGEWQTVGSGHTNADGRVTDLLPGATPESGTYSFRFEVAEYFQKSGRAAFYPLVEIAFSVENPEEHYHVPLLLSPFGYSTYRGS
jgi:5-hydroxyisourate hydrolase